MPDEKREEYTNTPRRDDINSGSNFWNLRQDLQASTRHIEDRIEKFENHVNNELKTINSKLSGNGTPGIISKLAVQEERYSNMQSDIKKIEWWLRGSIIGLISTLISVAALLIRTFVVKGP